MRATHGDSSLLRLAAQLTPLNGRPLNAAEIARWLGVSPPTALSRVQALERAGLVRLLPFFGGHHAPLLLLRDGCGADSVSFKAFCVDMSIRALPRILPAARFLWWKTGRVRQIDLLVTTTGERIGFCFTVLPPLRNREWLPLAIALKRGLIHRAFVLHSGKRAFRVHRGILALPLAEFFRRPGEWAFQTSAQEVAQAMRLVNQLSARAPWLR